MHFSGQSCAIAHKMDDTWRVLQALGAGPALPNRFNTLERLLESAVKSVRLKSTPELQMSGILAFCEEMQRILKIAFMENGFLAREIEEVTQAYQKRLTVYEGKIKHLEQQNKTVTAKVVKLGRKLQKMAQPRKVPTGKSDASTNTLPCGALDAERQWTSSKKCSDYDTLDALSDCQAPDFDQMVRFNTLLMEFIHDENREQMSLPMMGFEERSELARMASVYKVRCRFGKENVASAQLVKGRQSCLPAPGELDSIMGKYVTTEVEKRKPDPPSTGDTATAEKRMAQVKEENEEDLLLCSETVSQTSSSDVLSLSPLPPKATPLSHQAPGSSSRTHPQSAVGETATPLQNVTEHKVTFSEGSAVSSQPAQRAVQLDRAAGVDSPLLIEGRASSPSSGKDGGMLGSSLAGERSARKGKKTVPKVKQLHACTVSLPATKRIKIKRSDSDSSSTEQMDTSQMT